MLKGAVGALACCLALAVLPSCKDNSAPTAVSPEVTPAPTPAPTPPPTTQPPPPTVAVNSPPNAVFRVNPNPPVGTRPLKVIFNMCGSTDPDGDELRYSFDYDGDGVAEARGLCYASHTYQKFGLRRATVCVTDGLLAPGHKVCTTYDVDAR